METITVLWKCLWITLWTLQALAAVLCIGYVIRQIFRNGLKG